MSTPRDAVLSHLRRLAPKIAAAEGKVDALYAERLAAFEAGRAIDPPIIVRDLAEAAAVSPEAVHKQLGKARRRSA
jgi:hypothetical protein